jgi:hypothetical protein
VIPLHRLAGVADDSRAPGHERLSVRSLAHDGVVLLGTPDQIADAIRRDRALAEYGDFASSHIDTDHVRWAGDVAQAILNAIAADLAAEPGRQQQGDAERHHSRLRVDGGRRPLDLTRDPNSADGHGLARTHRTLRRNQCTSAGPGARGGRPVGVS